MEAGGVSLPLEGNFEDFSPPEGLEIVPQIFELFVSHLDERLVYVSQISR